MKWLFLVITAAVAVCPIPGDVWWNGYTCAPAFHTPLALDTGWMNHTANPCESFTRHVCGNAVINRLGRAFEVIHDDVIEKHLSEPLQMFYDSCVSSHPNERLIEYRHLVNTILEDYYTNGETPVVWARLARSMLPTPIALRWTETGQWEMHYAGLPLDLTQLQVQHVYGRTKELHHFNVIELQHGIQAVLKVHLALLQHLGNAPEYMDAHAFVHPEYLRAIGNVPMMRRVVCADGSYCQWVFQYLRSGIEPHEWKAYAHFGILFTLEQMRNQTRRCERILEHNLPRLLTNAFFDAYALTDSSKERIISMAHSLGITSVTFERPDAEEFADRISPDRYEHNLFLVRRRRVADNLAQKERVRGLYLVHKINDTAVDIRIGFVPPYFHPDYDDVSLYAILGAELGKPLSQVFHALFDARPDLGLGHKQHFFMVYAQARCNVELDAKLTNSTEFKQVIGC